MRVLVTDATGYIGGRLVPRLLDGGHEVRCMTRSSDAIDAQPWHGRVEIVTGGAADADRLHEAMTGCDAAVYLAQSAATGRSSDERDLTTASVFSEAAGRADLARIVYLGGLRPVTKGRVPSHFSGREEGRILASGPTPTTEIRAAAIIGSGSVSFEMLRHLTDVLPIMTTPRWARKPCRPIAVGDLLDVLAGATEDTVPADRFLEAVGPDVLTYQEMMRVYAEEAGLRRRVVIPLPVNGRGLSSLWVRLVTPLPVTVARSLVESLSNGTAAGDQPTTVSPSPRTPYREAVRRALTRRDAGADPSVASPGDPAWSGGTEYTDRRVVPTDAAPGHVFWAFTRIGGSVGYYGMNWAWRIRGALDRMVGGVGFRRGRRHPERLAAGETVDFWLVDQVVPDQSLRLRAEMRLPGDAWLEWEIVPTLQGSDLIQTARFRPRGVTGRLYWYAMAPFHSLIFPRMAARMAAAAEERGYSCD